jgi:hypothetical protein
MTVEVTTQQQPSTEFYPAAGIAPQAGRANAINSHTIVPTGYTLAHGQVLRRDRAMPVYPLDGGMVSALAAHPGLIPLVASQSAELSEVPVRSNGFPTEWDMNYIRNLSPEPDALDSSKLYVFESAPSTQFVDSLLTRMADSSLKNYVMDAFGGVAVMNSHRAGGSSPATLPVGRSFYGTIQPDPSNPGNKRFVAISYILRNNRASGDNTDDIIAAIQAGTLFDLSIGFRFQPGTPQNKFKDRTYYRCSICNAEWQPNAVLGQPQPVGDNGKDCNHWPGEVYSGELCFYWVENARLGEFSFVYGGATDAAVILKARKAAKEGKLTRAQVNRLEGLYHARISPTSTYTNPEFDFLNNNDVAGSNATSLRGITVDNEIPVSNLTYNSNVVTTPDGTLINNGIEWEPNVLVDSAGPVSERATIATPSIQHSPTNDPAQQPNNAITRSSNPVPPLPETTISDADSALRDSIIDALKANDIARAQLLLKEISPELPENGPLDSRANNQPGEKPMARNNPFSETAKGESSRRSELDTAARDNLKDSDFADPAGRKFPILDQDDVDSAARLIGKAGNKEMVKKRVIAIAKKKGLRLPDAWAAEQESDRSENVDNPNEIKGGEDVNMENEEQLTDDSERAVKSRTKVTVDPGDDDFDGDMDDLPEGNVEALEPDDNYR